MAYILCWVILWIAVRRPLTNQKISNSAFSILALGLLFLLRLPGIVFNQEISPDESQMIAQAMTLRQNPICPRSVDGTMGCPLDSYLLIIPSFFGLPFDYITAHLTAFGLVGLSLLVLFATAQCWLGTKAARLALVSVVVLLGLTQNGDLLHYSSGLVAVVLLSTRYYLLAVLLGQAKPSAGLLLGMDVLLGMVPFGKLQEVPLAAVAGLFAGLAVVFTNLSAGRKAVRLGALVAGSLLFPLSLN